MVEVLLFSGTTEGKLIQRFLNENKIETLVFVATEYGEEVLEKGEFIKLSKGRLDFNEMKNVFQKENPKLVIDATHPFAKEVTKNILNACEEADLKYIRFLREKETCAVKEAVYVKNIEEAVVFLNENSGNALITTGSKEIKKFTQVKNFEERLFPRILPMAENLKVCLDSGFKAKNIICMQGPFSQKANEAMLEFSKGKFLVTKETGKAGGLKEKLDACKNAGATPIIIGRPSEKGFSFEETKKEISKTFNLKRKVFIIGGGMGSRESLTLKAIKAIEESDIVITTKRLYNSLEIKNKRFFNEYNSKAIRKIMEEESFEKAAVIFSGDIGFFSGAKEIRCLDLDLEKEYISGISSFSEFMNIAGKTYEDVKTISLHGRNESFIVHVLKEKSVFLLLGGENTADSVCRTLSLYGLENMDVIIGENLGQEKEKLRFGKAKDFLYESFSPLSVMLIENQNTISCSHGFDDKDFIRGSVPMTKSEVRAVSLSKLRLKSNSVVYDIGAGTGSLSCEIGLICKDGQVFAVEREEKGIELIRKNKFNLGADNVLEVLGNAPECIKTLPSPTHVFIGGSGGSMKEIIKAVFEKNPLTRIVVNAISLETVWILLEVFKEREIEDYEIISLNVSKNKKIGEINLMEAQNPIYIISFTGKIW